jgi:hypothetical protein
MVIHFETIWEEAEQLSVQENINIEEASNSIQKHLNLLQTEPPTMSEYHMGEIIYHLCRISKTFNVNTYSALQKTIIDKKSEKLEI